MDKLPPQLQTYARQLDDELAKVSIANEFEAKTKIPKVYAAAVLCIVFLLLVFLNIWGSLLTNLLGFLYPAYASFKALETKDTKDDTQWLTYWVVFGFLNLIEFFADILLFWLPFYYVFKAGIIVWLALPHFNGAHLVYVRILRPILLAKEAEIDGEVEKIKEKAAEVITNLSKQK